MDVGKNSWRHHAVVSSLFVSGLGALLVVASLVLDRITVKDSQSKVKWVLAKRNLNLGYAVLGSSRAQLTTNVAELDDWWQTRGINLGLNGTAYPELDLIWELFLDANRVDCLLLEVDAVGLDSSSFSYPFHDYEYVPYLRDPIVFRHFLAERGLRAYLWRDFPFAAYAAFNDRTMISAAHALRTLPPPWDSTGTLLIDRAFDPNEWAGWSVKPLRIDSVRSARLDSILDRSARKGVHVIMYMAPEYFMVDRYQPNRASIIAFYREKARAHEVPFLTFEDSPLRRDKSNYFDPSHLNRGGARRFTAVLAATVDALPVLCVRRERGSRELRRSGKIRA
jgi:hypothetical protein